MTASVTVDESFDLVDTALALRDLRADDVTFVTSPSMGTATIDGQSVVEPDATAAKALYQAVRQDTVAQWLTPTLSNSEPPPS